MKIADCDCTTCAYAKKHPQLNARRCWHVTAETITDEQIKLQRSEAERASDFVAHRTAHAALGMIYNGSSRRGATLDEERAARARCADAWNARHRSDSSVVNVPLDAADARLVGETLRSWSNALKERCPDETLLARLMRVGDQMVAAARAEQAGDA